MMEPKLFDSQGRPVRLAAEIGRGGEGRVCQLADAPDRVAKLYHEVSADRIAKLRAMLSVRSEQLEKIAAWPVDLLFAGAVRAVAGFVMRRATGRQIHLLYGPKSRATDFPQANWLFLLRSAANLARAFAVVHEHGLIVGDVNHGNSLVSARATVSMIDCDSFQVMEAGRTFLCGVGVETHVPPELQGQDLSHTLRTRNHDAFGLSVLIFQLLFMGRHPFSGRFTGSGEMPIPRAIREFRFAYGQGAGGRQMEPPPNTPPVAAVAEEAAALFERAFSPLGAEEGRRPSALEWAEALDRLAGNLRTCGRNPVHQFLRTLPACPWCAIENASGVLLFAFSPLSQGAPPRDSGTFDLALAWARILAVPSPSAPPMLPDPKTLNVSASPAATRERRYRLALALAAAGCAATGMALGSLTMQGMGATVAIGLSIVAWLARGSFVAERNRALAARRVEQLNLDKLQKAWQREAGGLAFTEKLRELARKRDAHADLPAARQRGLAEIERGRRQRQLEQFLDRHRISATKLPGIGPARRDALQSFGIETAADLNRAAVAGVPGFGPALTATLLDWRTAVAGTFTFDASRGPDPADLRALDSSLARQRGQLERDLAAGPQQLLTARGWIETRRQALLREILAVSRRLAQAQADC